MVCVDQVDDGDNTEGIICHVITDEVLLNFLQAFAYICSFLTFCSSDARRQNICRHLLNVHDDHILGSKHLKFFILNMYFSSR